MRILTVSSILALILTPQAVQAQGRAAKGSTPVKAEEKVYSAKESAAMGVAVRKKAEAAERARTERLMKATGGICIGCWADPNLFVEESIAERLGLLRPDAWAAEPN
jgi:hypothetical protein